MSNLIPINIVVEDELSEAVAHRILLDSEKPFYIGCCYGKCGYGYIKKSLNGFNNAAKGSPFFVLVDLECQCPPEQKDSWLDVPAHNNLIFRISVKEVEAWLLADKPGIASYLGIRDSIITRNLPEYDLDVIIDPKKVLIDLARTSRRRYLREAIVPVAGSTAQVGPDYNGQLSIFVMQLWDITEAIKHSSSLRRAVNAVNSFTPVWS